MAGPRGRAGEQAGNEEGRGRMGTVGAAIVIGIAGLIGALIFATLKWTAPWLLESGLDSVVLLVAGFVTVALVLLVGTVVMTALGMRTPNQALGMPAGSIRALIAMVLILIFAIIGILVFNKGTSPEAYESTGITQSQIDALRAGGGIVLEQDLIPVPSAAPGASPPEATYTVRIRPGMTQESHDFGLQLMTTVSTLVVAVAGFYFGSKSLEQAVSAAKEFRPPQRPIPPAPDLIPPRPERSRDDDETDDEDGGPGGGTGAGGAGDDEGADGDDGTGEPSAEPPDGPPAAGVGGTSEAAPAAGQAPAGATGPVPAGPAAGANAVPAAPAAAKPAPPAAAKPAPGSDPTKVEPAPGSPAGGTKPVPGVVNSLDDPNA